MGDTSDPIFGPFGIVTRMAWLGAVGSFLIWLVALYRIWQVEGSTHHLVARVLSVFTMILMDVAIIIFFWPSDYIARVIVLDGDSARGLVGFVVGTQIMAALYQITAPPQGRVRKDGARYE